MAKYYVVSHDIKAVMSGPHITSPREAAKEAMLQYLNEGVNAAPIIIVSELGFDLHSHATGIDQTFDTEEILIEAGFIEEDSDYENL